MNSFNKLCYHPIRLLYRMLYYQYLIDNYFLIFLLIADVHCTKIITLIVASIFIGKNI